jgi:hypothetical protein
LTSSSRTFLTFSRENAASDDAVLTRLLPLTDVLDMGYRAVLVE